MLYVGLLNVCEYLYHHVGVSSRKQQVNNATIIMYAENKTSSIERYFFYNSLAVLLKAVEGERTTVDLRNESSIHGTVEQADGYMNIVMRDCVFTDPRGDKFSYEIFFVHARNIRDVHIPASIPIIPAIKNELLNLSGRRKEPQSKKVTFKSKRTAQNQRDGQAAVQRILKLRAEEKVVSENAQ